MNKLVSVIVPAYNVELYIDDCITSILNQTYKNLEIIIIDDGSFDNTLIEIKKHKKKDSRIKCFSQKNMGMSFARNVGLENASGEYITFVDSDDVLHPNFIKQLVYYLEKNESDIAICDFVKFENRVIFSNKELMVLKLSNYEAMSYIIDDKLLGQMVWNKIYKSEIVKNIKFKNGKYHEDIFWTYEAIGSSKNIVYFSDELYGYRQRKGSIMNDIYSEKRLDAIEAVISRKKYVEKYYPKLLNNAILSVANTCLYHYQYILYNKPNNYKLLLKSVYKSFNNNDFALALKHTNLKQRLWLILFSKVPKFTCVIRILLKIGW